MQTTHLSAFNIHRLGSITSVPEEARPPLTDIYLLVEYTTNASNPTDLGKPVNGKIDLDSIFNAIIDDVAEDDINLHIGRKLLIEADFFATDNYNEYINHFSNTTDDAIEYNTLANLQTEDLDLDDLIDALMRIATNNTTETSAVNLCVTTDILTNIEAFINSVSNKMFRNINQLIRVKRDWRLYGPGATLYGNYLVDGNTLEEHTSVPAECFVQKKAHYIAGKEIYEEPDISVGATVPNSPDIISQATTYAIGKHTHAINVSITANTKINYTTNAGFVKPYKLDSSTIATKADGNNAKRNWQQQITLQGDAGTAGWAPLPKSTHRTLLASGDGSNDSGEAIVGAYVNFAYSGGRKYLGAPKNSQQLNPSGLKLPAYGTYVWQWHPAIDDPTQL